MMSARPLKCGWKKVKFGEVVKNANLVERDPGANGAKNHSSLCFPRVPVDRRLIALGVLKEET